MFDECLAMLDEIIAAKKSTNDKNSIKDKKTTVKTKSDTAKHTKPRKKKKKKKPGAVDAGPASRTSKKHHLPKAANDDSAEAVVKHSLGEMGLKFDQKMDTSPKAMAAYSQSLSSFNKADKPKEGEKPTHTDEEVHNKAKEAVDEALKANPENAKAAAQGAQDIKEHLDKNPGDTIADAVKKNPNNKNIHKTAALICLGLAAGALFLGLAAINPGLAVVAGLHTLDTLSSNEVGGRILDHLLPKSKEDSEEKEDENQRRNNPDTEHEPTKDEQDKEDQEIDRKANKADSLIGDQGEAIAKGVDEVRNNPEAAEAYKKNITEELEKHKNEPNMGAINDKKGPELKEAWAKRAAEYAEKGRDSSLPKEAQEQHKRAARIAAGISSDPKQQSSMLEMYHLKPKKAVEDKEETDDKADKESEDKGAEDKGAEDKSSEEAEPEEQPPFPDKKEEKTYQKAIETVMDNEEDTIKPDDIKKTHKLTDEQATKFLDRMEKEGFVGKAGKDGSRPILDNDEGEEGDEGEEDEDDKEEPDDEPPSPKGKKVKASEQISVEAALEVVAEMGFDCEINSLLVFKGKGQDDLDKLGPAHVGPFKDLCELLDRITGSKGQAIDYNNTKNKIVGHNVESSSIKIFKNPSLVKLLTLSKNASFNELVGMVYEQDFYVWDPENGRHDEVIEQEGWSIDKAREDDGKITTRIKNGNLIIDFYAQRSVYRPILKNCPPLLKVLNNEKVGVHNIDTGKNISGISMFNNLTKADKNKVVGSVNKTLSLKALQRLTAAKLAEMASRDIGLPERQCYRVEGGPLLKEALIRNILDAAKNNSTETKALLDVNNDYTTHVKAPTYAALKLHPASGRLLKKWCEDNGIKGVYPKHEFHITVCYSKDPITYKPMVFTDGPKQVYPDKFDFLGRDSDKQFLVLKLKKGLPHKRFEYAQSVGASHDFPEYMPHISISPPGHGMTELPKVDVSKLPPLLIDYEYMDELNARLLVEAARGKVLLPSFDKLKDIHMKKYSKPASQRRNFPSIEEDTMIVPEMVADAVVNELAHFLYNNKLLKNRDVPTKQYIEQLVEHAGTIYANNEDFKNKLNGKGNKGRDYLYMFMRHWLSSIVKKDNAAWFAALPDSFKQGVPLKSEASKTALPFPVEAVTFESPQTLLKKYHPSFSKMTIGFELETIIPNTKASSKGRSGIDLQDYLLDRAEQSLDFNEREFIDNMNISEFTEKYEVEVKNKLEIDDAKIKEIAVKWVGRLVADLNIYYKQLDPSMSLYEKRQEFSRFFLTNDSFKGLTADILNLIKVQNIVVSITLRLGTSINYLLTNGDFIVNAIQDKIIQITKNLLKSVWIVPNQGPNKVTEPYISIPVKDCYQQRYANYFTYDEGAFLEDYQQEYQYRLENEIEYLRENYSEDIDDDAFEIVKEHLNAVGIKSEKDNGKGYTQTSLEQDSSIKSDNGAGVEIVSPKFTNYQDGFKWLKTVISVIKKNDYQTNESTGFHINIGGFKAILPSGNNIKDPGTLDLIKLSVFSGDKYLLKTFGRESNSYAESIQERLSRSINLGAESLNTPDKQLDQLIGEANQHFTSSSNRYVTINPEKFLDKGYIEFRIAGGENYEQDEAKLEKTIYRFMQLCAVASDYKAFRQNYLKRLSQLLPAKVPVTPIKPAFKNIMTRSECSAYLVFCGLTIQSSLIGRDITIRALKTIIRHIEFVDKKNLDIRFWRVLRLYLYYIANPRSYLFTGNLSQVDITTVDGTMREMFANKNNLVVIKEAAEAAKVNWSGIEYLFTGKQIGSSDVFNTSKVQSRLQKYKSLNL